MHVDPYLDDSGIIVPSMSTGPPFDCSPHPELQRLQILSEEIADNLEQAEENNDTAKVAELKSQQEEHDRNMSTLGWAITSDDLEEKFQITCSGILGLKSDSELSASGDRPRNGDGEFFSEEDAFQRLVRTSNGVILSGPRAVVRWIDLIHERVLSMTCRPGGPARENVTLAAVEKARVWGARDGQFYRVSGFIDRSEVPHQISEDPNVIHEFHYRTADGCDLLGLREYEHPTKFLFVKPCDGFVDLKLKVPQAILEMYSCAMCLEKKVIRGVITNAHEWIFLVLRVNGDGDGGVYFQSEKINLVDTVNYEPSREAFIIITKIIAHWVSRSYDAIGKDDLFNVRQ